jgi:hypothetical protein
MQHHALVLASSRVSQKAAASEDKWQAIDGGFEHHIYPSGHQIRYLRLTAAMRHELKARAVMFWSPPVPAAAHAPSGCFRFGFYPGAARHY